MATNWAHRFVNFIPDVIEPEIVYVSIDFAIAVHGCACGCGNEIVTPITPNDWSMTFDGEGISLAPSIGNWNIPCRSHYFIRRSCITWVPAPAAGTGVITRSWWQKVRSLWRSDHKSAG